MLNAVAKRVVQEKLVYMYVWDQMFYVIQGAIVATCPKISDKLFDF
jgi:hypothetical protein